MNVLNAIALGTLLGLAIPTQAGNFNVGISQGHHLLSESLNDTHPYVGYEEGSLGVVIYQNSFDKTGVALYNKFSKDLSGNLSLNLKVGLTTGYSEVMAHKGTEYDLSGMPFVTDGLMALVVPSVDYKMNSDTSAGLSLLGESVNIGITFTFD